MNIKVLDLSKLESASHVEERIQALYDMGFTLLDVAGQMRHLLIFIKEKR